MRVMSRLIEMKLVINVFQRQRLQVTDRSDARPFVGFYDDNPFRINGANRPGRIILTLKIIIFYILSAVGWLVEQIICPDNVAVLEPFGNIPPGFNEELVVIFLHEEPQTGRTVEFRQRTGGSQYGGSFIAAARRMHVKHDFDVAAFEVRGEIKKFGQGGIQVGAVFVRIAFLV